MSSAMPVQPGSSGKQKFPLRLFAFAFVISLLTSIFGGWQAWQMHERFQELSDKRAHVTEDIGRIMLFDEILTMSAHMTAATGEFAYETRYDQVDAQLTAVVNHVKADFSQAEIARHIGATDTANLTLVTLERQAFALVHQGKLQQATALLNGTEYLGLKKVYAVNVEKTADALLLFVETEQRHLHTLTDLAAVANIVGILVLVVAWLFAASYARRWAEERVEYQLRLRKSQNELEVRVEQRTADLTTANIQLQQEIAEHKQAQERLMRSETGLAGAQRIAHLGNWELDIVNNVLVWSDEIYRIFEIDPNKFGASFEFFLNAVHPDDREFVNNAYTNSVKDHTSYNIEHRLRMPDGREKFVNERCETLYDPSGVHLRSIGTVQDITERKRAEQVIAESDIRFREIFNSISDAIFIHDAETGRIIDVNHRMLEIYGLTREEALACGPDDLSAGTPPYSSAEAIEKIRLAHTEGPQIFDWLARARDGHLFWSEVNLRFVHIGNQWRILAIVHDISERKQAEANLAEQLNELCRWQKATSGRENRILELKHEINQLLGSTGQPPRYPSAEFEDLTEK